MPNDNEDEIKHSSLELQSDNNTVTVSDVQCSTQITPVALHHVNLSQVNISDKVINKKQIKLWIELQKKIILQTGSNGNVSVIDVVPLESSDSSDSQILVAESITPNNGQNENGQQVTAQGENEKIWYGSLPAYPLNLSCFLCFH